MNMKMIALVIAAAVTMHAASAQLKATTVCPAFTVDVLEGTINGKVDYNSTAGEVKKIFPCFTDVPEEVNGNSCGAVFFKDKDISFYTARNYIEIGEKFKGQLVPALIGVKRGSLFTLLGNPQIKDINWDAYKTSYGLLVLYYDAAGKINKLQITNKGAETLKLCE